MLDEELEIAAMSGGDDGVLSPDRSLCQLLGHALPLERPLYSMPCLDQGVSSVFRLTVGPFRCLEWCHGTCL